MPNDHSEQIIGGRRPVLEALKSDIIVERLILRLNTRGKTIGEIVELAKGKDLRIDRLPQAVFDRKFARENNGGVVACISPVRTVGLDDIIQRAKKLRQPPFIVMLDGVEDPHNLGAIARSAEGAGCHGMALPRRRISPLSDAAVKASAGALLHLPVARVPNLAQAMDYLAKKGVWIFGADMQGEDYRKVDYPDSLALVVGGEGAGLSRLVKSKCSRLLKIPLAGNVKSLNASVAAGILLFHIAGGRKKRK